MALGGIALFLIYYLRQNKTLDNVGNTIFPDKAEQEKRNEKGAINNTVDFLFGEGTAKNNANYFEDLGNQFNQFGANISKGFEDFFSPKPRTSTKQTMSRTQKGRRRFGTK